MSQEQPSALATRGPAASAVTRREEFDGTEIATRTETAATAQAASAAALVQARYVMAMRRPRDMDDVRTKLLRECQRPSFAKSAWYRKPIGQGIEGLSIRFVEAALRQLGNNMSDVVTVYEDELRRIDRVTVTDLESNVTHQRDVMIEKTVERNKIRDGQVVLSSRKNSNGQTTYLVVASEDELLGKEGALTSKALRTLGVRLLPGDIRDECVARIKATNTSTAAADPDAERKAVIDAFAGLGVLPSELKALLGKEIAQTTPSDIVDLRGLYTAIKEGEATFPDALAAAKAARGEAPEQVTAAKPIEERIKEQAAATKKTENAQEPPVPPAPAIPDSDQGMREMTDEEKDYQRSIAAQGPQSLPAAPHLKQRSIADEARARAQARRAAKSGAEE